MPDAPLMVVYAGAAVGILGGGIALFNAYKAVQWKRAELASAYIKELVHDPVLVFACRSLDWNGGKLVVPEPLRPLVPGEPRFIVHEGTAVKAAMQVHLTLDDLDADPRLQIYRTAIDDLLSWFGVVENSIRSRLFSVHDVSNLKYWVDRIDALAYLQPFIQHFGYEGQTRRLKKHFRPIPD